MDNEAIIEALENGHGDGQESESGPVQIVKYLVFLMGNRKFAIGAELIKEIVLDLPIFPIPFVPSYVRGLINRHGDPYTLIDLNVLFEQKLLDSSTFLIVADSNNPAAFLINDVIEIMKIAEDDVHSIAARDDNQRFVMGSITGAAGEEILVLDIAEIFKRLERDIAS